MVLAVRNLEKGPTVFSDMPNKIQIEWGGKNDPQGRDVQRVPDSLVENIDFMNAVSRGIFVVEEASPEIEEKLRLQGEAYRAARAHSEQEIINVMDPAQGDHGPIGPGGKTMPGTVVSNVEDPETGMDKEVQIPVHINPLWKG